LGFWLRAQEADASRPDKLSARRSRLGVPDDGIALTEGHQCSLPPRGEIEFDAGSRMKAGTI